MTYSCVLLKRLRAKPILAELSDNVRIDSPKKENDFLGIQEEQCIVYRDHCSSFIDAEGMQEDVWTMQSAAPFVWIEGGSSTVCPDPTSVPPACCDCIFGVRSGCVGLQIQADVSTS